MTISAEREREGDVFAYILMRVARIVPHSRQLHKENPY